MLIDVTHIQKRGNSWRYRRKVPEALRGLVGKREFLIPLAKSEAEAVRNYASVHATVERQLALAAQGKTEASHLPASETPLERFRRQHQQIIASGLDPSYSGPSGEDDQEANGRDVIGDAILDRYRHLPKDKDGYPVGMSDDDEAMLHRLGKGARQRSPQPTLEDAKRLYLKEKVRGDERKTLQLEHVFRLLADAIPLDRTIASLRREDAKEARDYMLDGGRAAVSVDRYLNVVRAVINHAIKEHDLSQVRNPFMGLQVEHREKAEPDRKKRRGFTDEELAATRGRVLVLARDDLRLVWRILEGTGCRLSEVTGLRREDMRLDGDVPHLDVEWHEERRVKTAVSRRKVPLLGDALEAAREAVKAAGDSRLLFPAYCREGGGDAASAALGKHVRATVKDPKVTTHSLRHRMKDRLRLAGVSDADQEMLLGHSSGKVGSDYGSEAVRLEVARRALEKARTIFQFRSFILAAWSKQFINGLNFRDFTTFTAFATSSFAAALTYIGRTHLNAIGRSDREEWLEKRLTPQAIALSALQNSSWFSNIAPAMDVMSKAFTDQSLFDSRTTMLASDPLWGNPSVDLGNSALAVPGSLLSMAVNGQTKEDWGNVKRVLPYQNLLGVTQLYSVMVSDLPDWRDRRD